MNMGVCIHAELQFLILQIPDVVVRWFSLMAYQSLMVT